MNKEELIAKYSPQQLDNFHILIWLFKDAFWLMGLKIPATLMIFPALGISILLTVKAYKAKVGFMPTFSVMCWLLANCLWMLNEFYKWETTLFAICFFSIGLMLMLYFYIWECDILGIKKKTSL